LIRNAFALQLEGKYGIRTFYPGMKRMLDQYIQKNYTEVLKYTKHFIQRLKIPSSIEADAVINNAYLHCVKLEMDEVTEDKAKSYLLNTIKYELIWTQGSRTKKDDIYRSHEYLGDSLDDSSDIEHKVNLEESYNFKKAMVEIYRNSLDDRIKKIIFEAYYDKGHSTQTALAKYFDINSTSAFFLIKEIKQNIKEIQYRYNKD
jgi:hypothetical protein